MTMKQYVSTPTPSERNRTAAPCRWASESEQARIHSTTKQYNRVASFENLKFNVTRVPGHLDTSMHQPEVGTLVLHADLPIFTREKEECWTRNAGWEGGSWFWYTLPPTHTDLLCTLHFLPRARIHIYALPNSVQRGIGPEVAPVR